MPAFRTGLSFPWLRVQPWAAFVLIHLLSLLSQRSLSCVMPFTLQMSARLISTQPCKECTVIVPTSQMRRVRWERTSNLSRTTRISQGHPQCLPLWSPAAAAAAAGTQDSAAQRKLAGCDCSRAAGQGCSGHFRKYLLQEALPAIVVQAEDAGLARGQLPSTANSVSRAPGQERGGGWRWPERRVPEPGRNRSRAASSKWLSVLSGLKTARTQDKLSAAGDTQLAAETCPCRERSGLGSPGPSAAPLPPPRRWQLRRS
ncbi:PREDICTED: uncharacterized protein LOC106146389 isoform X3 [Chinchilla lanigera]|uniref:uncharacterized protein LOC106146389 isoform X3 n=1 Tax=Chinchilla lanigera TaxID=34839 RepID=UPI0006963251|nr:PREDICTED: uncharacterized protein LOC106146389 isoform X3 [Chinchilla lanigera]